MGDKEIVKKRRAFVGISEHWLLLLLLAGLFMSRFPSYLLFHSLVEIVSVALAWALFMVLWNTWRHLNDGYFAFLAVVYGTVAILDLVHTLAYKGMGVFPGFDANLPTQLWIAARALQAASLVAATAYIGRRPPRAAPLLLGYGAAVALLLVVIFWGWFPTCYVEGQGLTVFKRVAEYAISGVLLLALALLLRKRRAFERDTLFLLVGSLVATVVSELAFTFYVGVYDLSNMFGHLAKVVAFYMLYVALVEAGLRRPYDTLFRDLKQSEGTLWLRTRELGERVKELDCLYGISALVERPGGSLEGILQGAAELLVQAMQFPSSAAARVVLDGREYQGANYRETPWQMVADLVVGDERRGTVQVVYLEEKPPADEGPFLLAERRLLDAVAERLGRIVERNRAAELLQESERKFRSLVEQSQDGITLTDEQGAVVEWNRAMEQMTGRSASDALGRPIWEVMFELGRPEERTETTRRQIAAAVQESLRAGRSAWLGLTVERAFVRADGAERTLAGTIFPVQTAGGFMLASILRDVTDARKVEDSLRAKDTAMAAAYDAFAMADLAGNLTYVNAAFLRMWGYEREDEVLGRPAVEFWQEPEQAAEIIPQLRQQENVVGELVGRRRDGSTFDARLSVDLVRDATGRPLCLLGVFSDVTERRQVERRLRQAKEEWEKTFDAVPDLIAIMDTEYRIVRMNRAMAERLGCEPEDCLGQPCYVHVHGTSEPLATCPHSLLLQDHQEHTAELHEERLGGDFVVTVSPLWGPDGQFQGSVHVARDVTERNRATEALRKSEEAHRRLFETMPQGVVYQDAGGAILSANPAAQEILGLSLDQMQGRTSVDPRWRAIREDGSDFPGETHPAMAALRTGQPVSGVVMGVYNPRGGQTRWIKIDAVPLFRSGEQVPHQVYTTFDDITARKQFAEVLRLNEQRLDSLLELSQKAGELSEQKIVQVAIEQAERLTGSRLAYLHYVYPGETAVELVAWSEATRRECTATPTKHYPLDQAGIWADCVRQRAPVVHNDYPVRTDRKGYPEGHVHLVRHASVPIFEDDRIVLVLGVGNKATDYDEADVRQLLLIGSAVMRILRRKRAESALQASLHEKVVLLQEVHHRVKNNLQVISSLLDMQAMTTQDAQTLQALQDSRNRVRAMAFVHDRLYQSADLAWINAPDYLESVAGYLHGIYAGRIPPVEIHFDIQDIRLDLDTAIPCGLVVNELVSNALKYAFPPGRGPDNHVHVFLRRQNGDLVLEVQDNGVGLPAGLDIAGIPSLGLRLVSMLTQQLRGTLKVVREGGTAFCLTFPAADVSKAVRL